MSSAGRALLLPLLCQADERHLDEMTQQLCFSCLPAPTRGCVFRVTPPRAPQPRYFHREYGPASRFDCFWAHAQGLIQGQTCPSFPSRSRGLRLCQPQHQEASPRIIENAAKPGKTASRRRGESQGGSGDAEILSPQTHSPAREPGHYKELTHPWRQGQPCSACPLRQSAQGTGLRCFIHAADGSGEQNLQYQSHPVSGLSPCLHKPATTAAPLRWSPATAPHPCSAGAEGTAPQITRGAHREVSTHSQSPLLPSHTDFPGGRS